MVDTCFYAPEVFQRLVGLSFVGKLCCVWFLKCSMYYRNEQVIVFVRHLSGV